MAVKLTEEQRVAVENTGGCLLVSAAAGSGKTKVLVDRVMRLVSEGIDLDRLLIITFTKAAAAELRERILDVLQKRQAEQSGDRHLERQLSLVYQAQISTIHSFCQTLLKEEGYHLELDADFRIVEEDTINVLQQQVIEQLLEEHYERVEEGDSFSLLLDTMSAGKDDKKLIEMVRQVFKKVQSHAEPRKWLLEQIAQFRLTDITSVEQTEWAQEILHDSLEQMVYYRTQLEELLGELLRDNTLPKHIDVVQKLLDDMDAFVNALRSGWDEACRASKLNYGSFSKTKQSANTELAAYASKRKGEIKKKVDKITERFERSDAQLMEDLRATAPAVIALLELVLEFDTALTREKRRRRIIDFNDMEHYALRLLMDEEGGASTVAKRYQQRFAEVMVDEYQDTNQVQNQIFRLITEDGRKLFMVGDVKQSIYRFRLADPSIFLGYLNGFRLYTEAQEGEARKVILSKNFRSRKSVLNATNFIFRGLMSEDFGGMTYNWEHQLNWGLPYPDYPEDRTELHILDMECAEHPEDGPKVTGKQVEAEYIAQRIRKLKDSGYQVTEGDGFRPVEWSDIVILHRSPKAMMANLAAALDAQRIPWQTEEKGAFFASVEITVAMSYLQIIDNPHQDIALVSVLRSPLYGFTPDQLAEIRSCRPGEDFYTALVACAEQGDRACTDFLQQLNRLRSAATDCTAASILWELYEQTFMLPIFAAQPGGMARRSNLILLYEHARSFEQNGYRGLFDFLTQIRRLQEMGKEIDVKGTRGSGVRIMTIHKSKGLEFPVVILAGLSHKFNTQDEKEPMLFHERIGLGPYGMDLERGVKFPTIARTAVKLRMHREMCAEELRLLYVAMTRAREKLIMITQVGLVGKGKSAGEDSETLKGLIAKASFPMDPQELKGMTSMGPWVIALAMTRPEAAVLHGAAQPVNLYCHSDAEPDTPWEIHLVAGETPEQRRAVNAGAAEAPAVPVQSEGKPQFFTYPHAELTEIPSKLTATQLKGRYQDQEAAEEAEELTPIYRSIAFRRPEFTQKEQALTPAERGTAMHLFMQLCDPERVLHRQAAREELNRLVVKGCITEAQAKAIRPEKATAFFLSEYGTQARMQGMEREFKFSILSDAGRYFTQAEPGEQVLLQGVVDLWYRTLEGLVIVDFKTDYVVRGEEAERAEQYRGQLDTYASALSDITGEPVAHRYLWFFGTDTAVEL